MVLILATSISGVKTYEKQVNDYQKIQLQAKENTDSGIFFNFPEPKIMKIVFSGMIEYIAVIGAILAILLGFNSISGERSRGTLKVLLSYPLYRDNVINGKFLGKIGILVFTLVCSFSIAICVTLIMGISISLSELGVAALFLIISCLYLVTFFGISMFFSVISKKDSDSLLYSIIVWVISAMVISSAMWMISEVISPSKVFIDSSGVEGTSIIGSNENIVDSSGLNLEQQSEYDDFERIYLIQMIVTGILSPTENYKEIASNLIGVIGYNSSFDEKENVGTWGLLMESLPNLVVLIVFAVLLLVLSYVIFMRQDIR